MTEKNRSTLPRPFGEELESGEWRRAFLKIRKDSPVLNLFNGKRDQECELQSFMASTSGNLEVVVSEFPRTFADTGSNPLVLVRGQYFDSGLHHRISFHASVRGRVMFEETPACVLAVIAPIRQVSNLYVAYPSKEKPLFLEIPIAGAPPDVRVVEMSMNRMKAYIPGANRLLPETKYIKDMRVQFVDVGEVLVSGEARSTGKEEVSIKLSPLSTQAHRAAERYLEAHYREANAKGTAREQDAAEEEKAPGDSKEKAEAQAAEPESGPKRALVVLQDPFQRKRVEAILAPLGWQCEDLKDYAAVRSMKTLGKHSMIVLDAHQGNEHSVDLLRSLIRDEVFAPTRFILVGDRAADAREVDWPELGTGLFLRTTLPDNWLKVKTERWLKAADNEIGLNSGDPRPLVLVVDDDTELRNSIGALMTYENYRVVTAGDGIEAIRSVRNLKPDLMLLDIEMPGRTGLEVLRTIRAFKMFRRLPIIIVSGRRDIPVLEEAISLGVTDYLVKPFDDLSLLQRARSALKSPDAPAAPPVDGPETAG